jgi:hypothetical protein
MGDLGNKILERIKEEKIEPRPRWQFLLKDYFVWSAFGISLLVGALAFCVMLSIILDNDWDIYRYLEISPFEHFLISLPYLWILLLFLFLAIAYYNYRHTKKGYCCKTFTILALSIFGSLILGTFFHSLGLGGKIDRTLSRNFPVYQKIHCCCHRQDIWSQPEKGLLGGRITGIKSISNFDLEDFNGLAWQIEKDEGAFLRGPVLVEIGEEVRLIGKKKSERVFRAFEIRPWWNREEE